MDLSYDIIPRIQDPSLFSGRPNVPANFPTYRLIDLEARLYPGSNGEVKTFGVFQNLDRILVTINMPWADLFLGRQAIAWGSSRVVNPTDVLAPYTFDELDPEDRVHWKNKGIALDDLGRYEDALQAYDKALELNPSDSVLTKRRIDLIDKVKKNG